MSFLEGTLFAKILPSAMTFGALSCGISAIRFGLLKEADWAIYCLSLAAILDGLDGHVARALKASTDIGAELDSLCDLVDFGVAPALVLYFAANVKYDTALATQQWIACLAYCCSCAFRLARYNVHDHEVKRAEEEAARLAASTSGRKRRASMVATEEHTSKWLDAYLSRDKFFQGCPAPMAAGLALIPVAWRLQFETDFPLPFVPSEHVPTVFLLGVACLMVSTLPMLSSKMFIKGKPDPNNPHTSHLRSRSNVTLLLKIGFVVCFAWASYTFPWLMFLVIFGGYLALLPVGYVLYHFFLTSKSKSH